MNEKNYWIACNAILAAAYAACTIAIAPIAYGEIQFRISEILVLLAFYNRKFFPGLILGCFIANCFSPMLAYDVPFGTLATAIVCFGMYYGKSLFPSEKAGLFFAALVGAVVNGLIVGFELHLAFQIPFLINALYVALGELAVLVIGVFAFLAIGKNQMVRSFLMGEVPVKASI